MKRSENKVVFFKLKNENKNKKKPFQTKQATSIFNNIFTFTLIPSINVFNLLLLVSGQ